MASIAKLPSGRWQAKIRRQGQPPQSETFGTKAAAQAWARSVERAMDTDSYIPPNDAQRLTYAKAAERYEQEVVPRLRGQVQARQLLARTCEKFGGYSLAKITPMMLSSYRDERLKAVSAQTVVHELGIVSRVFKAAALDWGIALPKGNPVTLVRKPKIDNGRDRRLEGIEEQLLLAAMKGRSDPWYHAATVLAIETAGRQSELASLVWEDVDLKRRVARLRGVDGGVMKNGSEYRDVPLSPVAVKLLEDIPRSKTGQGRVLQVTSQMSLQVGWGRALRQARKVYVFQKLREVLQRADLNTEEIERELRAVEFKKRQPLPLTRELLTAIEDDTTLVDLHFHDLRHEATSRLAEIFAMHELMKITGHKDATMVARYYHPRVEDLAKKLA